KTEKLITHLMLGLEPRWERNARKRDVLNWRWLVGLSQNIIQAGAPKAHQTALPRNAAINKIDINSPLKRI
ncbi:hypothetical protein TNCV_1231561, partial [Trichonephila clavipes]